MNPISCAFTLSHDNRAVAELWFNGEKSCSDAADIIEKSRKVIAINGQDFSKVSVQKKRTFLAKGQSA